MRRAGWCIATLGPSLCAISLIGTFAGTSVIAGCAPPRLQLLDAPPIRPDTPPFDAGMRDAPDAPPDVPMDVPPDVGVLCRPAGVCSPFSSGVCGTSQACVPRTSGTACVSPRSPARLEGASCVNENDCAPGLACLDGPGGLRCRRLCRARSLDDCSPGDVCAIPAADDTCLRYCVPACDLTLQDCAAGEGCFPFRVDGQSLIACLPAGTTPIGGVCEFANSCVRGAACLGGECLELCEETRDCSAGTCMSGAEPGVRFCL